MPQATGFEPVTWYVVVLEQESRNPSFLLR
jgi:hypothetical protein